MIALALAVIVSTGAIDPNCTVQDVCKPGYTDTIRPPSRVTNAWKKKECQRIGSDDVPGCMASNEADHYEPMETCGDPVWRKIGRRWVLMHPENIWLEPWPEARRKDPDETRLHRAVCKGQMTLKDAQAAIRKHWKIYPTTNPR